MGRFTKVPEVRLKEPVDGGQPEMDKLMLNVS